MFQHTLDSKYFLIIHRELNNIQGLSKESDLFQDEDSNNIGELEETNKKVARYNVHGKNKDPKVKRIALYIKSQYDNILKVTEATKTIMIDKIKLDTHDT